MPAKKQVSVRVVITNPPQKKHPKLSKYQVFVKKYAAANKRAGKTNVDMREVAKAWNQVKQQAYKNGVSPNDVKIQFD